MRIDKNWKVGCLYFIGTVCFMWLSRVLWNSFDGFWGGLYCFIGVALAIVCFCFGCHKTWSYGNVDSSELKGGGFKLGIRAWVIWLLVILGVIWWIISGPVHHSIEMYNQNITYTNQLTKQMQARKMFFDKMWKTYLLKNDICELNRETFLETTQMIMEGRHDGENVTWKWVHENQNIPYSEFQGFYKDLSDFVNSQREEYYKIENSCMEIVQSQNSMLDSLPNLIYNKVLGIEKLKYDPGFTSTHTEEVYKTKKEEI